MLQFKPWKVYINNTLRQIKNPNSNYLDFLPLWNHHNHCGAPFIANLQSQVFYPFSIIFYLIQDFVTAYKVFIILHFFLSMVFMFLLLRRKNLSFVCSLLGSILWGLNGFMLSRVEFLSVLATVIWLPLIILVFDSIVCSSKIRKIIILGVILAVQFLAGHAQMWVYSIGFLVCYSIYCSFVFKTLKPILTSIASISLSVLFSSIQFLPTLEFVLNSTRALQEGGHFGMTYEQAALGSLKFSDLINFIYPFNWQATFSKVGTSTNVLTLSHYWLYTFYIGTVGVLLSIIGWLKNKKEQIFYLLVILLTISYALGENFLLYNFVYKNLAFTRIFRHPSVVIYIPLFILCILAAEGTQVVKQIAHKCKLIKLIYYLIPLMSFCELYYYGTKISMLLPKSILSETLDTINFLMSKNKTDPYPYRFFHTPLTQKVATTISGKTFYTAVAKYRDKLFSNINLEYGLYNFRGQDIELANYHKFMNFVYKRKTIDEAIPYLSISNVKYILSAIEQKTSILKLVKTGQMKIYENPFVLPPIYPVTKVIVEPDIQKGLLLLEALGKDIYTTAIIHSKELLNFNIPTEKNYNFVIHHLEFKPNKIFAVVTTETPVFLVVSQNHYAGWSCKVDNVKTKIYHCNVFMKGFYLQNGTHQIRLYYDPLSFKVGCIVTLISILFCSLYLFEESEYDQ